MQMKDYCLECEGRGAIFCDVSNKVLTGFNIIYNRHWFQYSVLLEKDSSTYIVRDIDISFGFNQNLAHLDTTILNRHVNSRFTQLN